MRFPNPGMTPAMGGSPLEAGQASNLNLGGLVGARNSGQAPSIRPPAPPVGNEGMGVPPGVTPDMPMDALPGISGITPGAVERRLTAPATQQMIGQPQGPTQAGPMLRAENQNSLGVDPSSVQHPLQMMEAILRRQRRGNM